MLLNWRPHLTLSSIHAAWCLASPKSPCPPQAEPLRDSAAHLHQLVCELDIPTERLWDSLISLAPTEEGLSGYAARVLKNCSRSAETDARAIEFAVRECKLQFQRAFPKYMEEIRLRQEPLKQMWEAQGPGLLFQAGKLTDPSLIAENAEVILVQPIRGGSGYAHLRTNRVHVEAVLTNTNPVLPETMRLAWLLSRLDFERPIFSELVNSFQLRVLSALAMLPPILVAAQEIGISEYSTDVVSTALDEWGIESDSVKREAIVQILAVWWETFAASRPDWRTALTGLQRMLAEILPTA